MKKFPLRKHLTFVLKLKTTFTMVIKIKTILNIYIYGYTL